MRSQLVNTTLTNLHVLHQYKNLLNLVKDNFMTRPRVNKKIDATSPRKPIITKEIQDVHEALLRTADFGSDDEQRREKLLETHSSAAHESSSSDRSSIPLQLPTKRRPHRQHLHGRWTVD